MFDWGCVPFALASAKESLQVRSQGQSIRLSRAISCTSCTPRKFNMEPENNGFQMDFPFPGTYFQVPCYVSGVYQYVPGNASFFSL